MNTTLPQRFVVKVMVLLGLLSVSHAFQSSATDCKLAHTPRTLAKLNAWSMPSSKWYDEINPTARMTVYDEAPMEWTFVTLGDDWPTISDSPDEDISAKSEQLVRNPFRRAAQWARRVRRRQS